jgi:hypothetical protein
MNRTERRNLKRNPVVQALARKRLQQVLTTEKIKLYMLSPGEACEPLMVGIGQTLTLVGYALELTDTFDKSDVRFRILQGGISACYQMAQADRWDPLHANAIALALDKAAELYRTIPEKNITQALNALVSFALEQS